MVFTPMQNPVTIEDVLRSRRGAASSLALQRDLGVSQPTISRLLKPLIMNGHVLRAGAGKNQLYLLPQRVSDLGLSVPINRVDEDGRAHRFANIIALVSSRFCVEFTSGTPILYDSLPWFLSDMKPQGFLGRTFAKSHPSLNLHDNPATWSDVDTLRAIALVGDDLPGNLIVGSDAFARFQGQPRPAITSKREDYPALASRALDGDAPGSSAGGEQPKFCTRRADGTDLIVKFSPSGKSDVAQRWRDLLICEHLALETLHRAGESAASSSLHISDRVYLEVERFDRTPAGRIGMVSLAAFDDEHIGQRDRWDKTALRLRERALMAPSCIERLLLLEAFGSLIANSDRHYGNASLLRQVGAWTLAPAYDMLPMFYAPSSLGVPDRPFDLSSVNASAETLDVWDRASKLAVSFWQAARSDTRISTKFRKRLTADSDKWLARFVEATAPAP